MADLAGWRGSLTLALALLGFLLPGAGVAESDEQKRLSPKRAAALAARLANEECERMYDRRPFAPTTYPVRFEEDRFEWGRVDPGGEDGFSAAVSFDRDGRDAVARCYFSTDVGHIE